MHRLAWLRADLARPGRPVEREELPFLVVSAAAIVTAAQLSEPGSVLDLALLVLAGVALAAPPLLPRVPLELLVLGGLACVGLAVAQHGELELSYFLVVTATLYAAWHLGSTVRAAIIAAMCAAVMIVVAFQHTDSYAWTSWVTAEVFVLVLGRTLFHQHTLIAELEAARGALAEQAVADERRRIARELHDLAGHTLAAMMLHVGGARHVLRRDLDEAERALRDAEAVGRASLDQIRATVAALRTTERGTDAPLADAGMLQDLVAEYQRAGLDIEADLGSDVLVLDGPVAVALHRITREALANVARHAPANRVELAAGVERDASRPAAAVVHLRVTDRGRRPGPEGTGGYGLVGMRERARALGGSVVAGPQQDGWQVAAELPLTPAAGSVSEVLER